jgi:hypothetical protein
MSSGQPTRADRESCSAVAQGCRTAAQGADSAPSAAGVVTQRGPAIAVW